MPRGHYRRRWKPAEPRYILPDEVEAIRRQIEKESKKALALKRQAVA